MVNAHGVTTELVAWEHQKDLVSLAIPALWACSGLSAVGWPRAGARTATVLMDIFVKTAADYLAGRVWGARVVLQGNIAAPAPALVLVSVCRVKHAQQVNFGMDVVGCLVEPVQIALNVR